MKIAFFGLPLAACLLARDGHDLVFAGLSFGSAPGERRLTRALGEARVVVKPTVDRALVDRLRALAPDVVVSWFWTTLLPMTVIDVAKHRGIGVHPSLLPRHRGPDPTSWAILSADAVTGVTAHRLEADYDTGAVLGQRPLPIDSRWNAWQLAKALDRPSLSLLRHLCGELAAGRPLDEEPQDEALATEAPFLDGDARILRWGDSADAIVRRVRALAPSPGATMEIGGDEIVVLQAEVVPSPTLLERPGESLVVDGRCLVRARDGAIAVLAAELGGERVTGTALAKLFLEAPPHANDASDKRR